MGGIAGSFAVIPAVWLIGGLNVVIFLIVEAAGGTTDLDTMYRFGAQPQPLAGGEWWRMIASTFLHFGIVHLAVNLWALAIFGPLFERIMGSGRFLALYLASGLAGSAASALFAPEGSLGAGASGAIFGLLGAFLVLGIRLRHTPQGRAWLRQALLLVGVNVAFGLSAPGIGLAAHLGGLVGGMVVFGAELLAGVPGLPRGVLDGVEEPWAPYAGSITALIVAVGAIAIGIATSV
jgi:rhomboid protease GluP